MSKQRMSIDEKDFKNITAVMVWAYEHDLEVSMLIHRSYGDVKYPKLRFSNLNNDQHIEVALWDACVNRMESVWRDVGMKLCVEPPEFLKRGKS